MTTQGPPPIRHYGEPLPGVPAHQAGRRRGQTVLMFVAAVLVGVLIGLLLGLWYRDRDADPVVPATTTTTTTTAPPGQPAPTTEGPAPTTVPRVGPTTTGSGSGISIAILPIPPDTESPLAPPPGMGG